MLREEAARLLMMIQEFVHTMNARALNTLKAVKSAKRALKVPEGQQSMKGESINGK